ACRIRDGNDAQSQFHGLALRRGSRLRRRPGACRRGRRAAYARGSLLCAVGAWILGVRLLSAQTVFASPALVAGMYVSIAKFARQPLLAGCDLCAAGKY